MDILARVTGIAALLGPALVAQAQASDLPSGKAAPVKGALERCPEELGDGFYRIPGTNTCLAIGGIVERTVAARGTGLRDVSTIAFGADASFAFDARTQTEWGDLRTFFRGTAYVTVGDPSFSIDYAFVSLGGFEAGLTDSLFGFLGNGPAVSTLRSPNLSSTQFRYKWTLPAGFKLAVSVDSQAQTRPSAVPQFGEGLLPALRTNKAGTRAPDVVAALSAEGDWGSAQLSAVAHQVRSIVPLAGSTLGFAALGGLELNVPQIGSTTPKASASVKKASSDDEADADEEDAPTDTLGAQVVMAQAATAYLGFSTGTFGNSLGIGTVDTVVGPTGKLVPVQGESAMAYFAHVWNDKWTQNLFGSFAAIDVGQGQYQPLSLIRDFREYRVGTNLVYTPVDGLDITCADICSPAW
jgi:hypothetical protein